MNRRLPDCWAVVPAAGVGRRMGGPVPKQYLPLAGRPVIEHTLGRLLGHPGIRGVVVVLGPEDGWWPQTAWAADARVIRAPGGAERCHSVLGGLQALAGRAGAGDWVLVHDAARPCLRAADIDRLRTRLAEHPVGGLLGVPVRDTMKRGDPSGAVLETVPREGLWHAFTPQMFRLGMLREALAGALARGDLVTDEASAMERAGHRPLLVEGHPDNLKITRPEDLALAEFYLSAAAAEASS
jgi:2-C-methyl-D-erythritol 4-phosphate cytidylyltransferase